MNRRYIILCLVFMVCLLSCREEGDHIRAYKTELSVSLEPGMWIYYSISGEKIVGQSAVGNAADDEKWSRRTDWDLAFSEYGMRTNSGTSGQGGAGLAFLEDSLYEGTTYHALDTMQYTTDIAGVCIPVPLQE